MSEDLEKILNEIIKSKYNMVYRYCARRVSRNDAEDITNETLFALCEQYPTINPNAIDRWLLSTAANKIHNLYREKEREAKYIEDILPNGVTEDQIGFSEIEEYSDEDIDAFKKEIIQTRLTGKERELYFDKFVDGMSYEELSKKYSANEVSIRKRVSRLRKIIKELVHGFFSIFSFLQS